MQKYRLNNYYNVMDIEAYVALFMYFKILLKKYIAMT